MAIAKDIIKRGLPTEKRKMSAVETKRRRMEFYFLRAEQVYAMKTDALNFANPGALPARYLSKERVASAELRELFTPTSRFTGASERKDEELRILQGLLARAKVEFEREWRETRLDHVNETLHAAAAKEIGFAREAFEMLKRERPGAASRKDKAPGTLTAIRKGGKGVLLH